MSDTPWRTSSVVAVPLTPGRRARRRVVWAVVAAIVLVLAAWGVALALDASRMREAADTLKVAAADARDAIAARDVPALKGATAVLSSAADEFASATEGPQWWMATRVPWVQDQAIPLTRAGAAVRALAEGALGPLAELPDLDALAGPQIIDGRLDPLVLEPYRATLAQASATLAQQQEILHATDLSHTLDALAGPFVTLQAQLDELAPTIHGAHVAAEVLPAMLGGEGPRTYVVMVQNSAEPRTTGGVPGALIAVTVDDGRISLGRYAPARALMRRDDPVPITAEEESAFTWRMGAFPQDANFTPEFPRTGELIAEFWLREYGETIDGVASVDPVALSWMLEGAPATEIDGFRIDANNLVDVMLNEAYLALPDDDDQDAFFARASADLFDSLVGGQASPLDGVQKAIPVGRFMVWSSHAEEQERLATTRIAGGFLDRDDALGVFLNDGSGSKIAYYVDVDVATVSQVCADGRLARETLEVTFRHTFDGDLADLPDYVDGGGLYVPEGEYQSNLLVFPRSGTGIASVTRNGEEVGIAADVLGGRQVAARRVVVAPGETVILHYEMVPTVARVTSPVLVVTPGVADVEPERTAVQAAC